VVVDPCGDSGDGVVMNLGADLRVGEDEDGYGSEFEWRSSDGG